MAHSKTSRRPRLLWEEQWAGPVGPAVGVVEFLDSPDSLSHHRSVTQVAFGKPVLRMRTDRMLAVTGGGEAPVRYPRPGAIWTAARLARNPANEIHARSRYAVRLRRYVKPRTLYIAVGCHHRPRPIAWATDLQDVDGQLNARPHFHSSMRCQQSRRCWRSAIGRPRTWRREDTGGNIRRTGQYVINLLQL